MKRTFVFLTAFCLLSFLSVGEEHAGSLVVCRHLLVVPVELNGQGPFPFVVDLGLQRPVLGMDVAENLKLSTALDASEGAGVAMVDSVEVDRVRVKEKQFLVMDLSGFNQAVGFPVAGLFNPRAVVAELALDLPSRTFLASGKGGGRLDPAVPGVVTLRYADKGEPVVSAVINGSSVRPFVLDTTFEGAVSIPGSALREMGLLQDDTPRIETLAPPPADGTPTEPADTAIRLKSIRVGQAEIIDPICTVGSEGSSMRIGLGFLRRFRVMLNFEKNLLKLEYLQPPPLREAPVVGVGLVPAAFDGRRWTVSVAAGSSSAEAGLRSGDVLISVGEKDAAGLAYDAVVALLSAPEGAKVTISAQHPDGELVRAELGSRKLL